MDKVIEAALKGRAAPANFGYISGTHIPSLHPNALAAASNTELRTLEQELLSEVALRNPADLAATLEPDFFLCPPHIRLMSDTITKIISTPKRAIDPVTGLFLPRRLLVTMPPRHGKSELLSRYTPAWFILKHPNLRVILTSYEADFAEEWGRKVRELVQTHGPLFNVQLNQATKAAKRWYTTQDGGMQTAGARGPITGKGAHLFIIDDPFKNSEEANSELIRQKVFEWYQGTVFTRLEPDANIILIQTRWHEDDLAGRILADPQESAKWHHINFPATAEEHDTLGRAPGDPLWPARYDAEDLEEIKNTVGSYVWNALYQQKPYIEGGGILRPSEFHRYTTRDEYYRIQNGQKTVNRRSCWRFITLDTAATVKTTSDYTCAAVFDVTPDREALLIDLIRVKIESAEHISFLRRLFETYDPRFIGIENRTFGTTLIQTALRQGLRVRELKADTDKVTRAYGLSPYIENGRMLLPVTASYLADLEHELQAFPYGTHDDQVDCLAYAARVLQDERHTEMRRTRPEISREEAVFRGLQKEKKGRKYHPTLGLF